MFVLELQNYSFSTKKLKLNFFQLEKSNPVSNVVRWLFAQPFARRRFVGHARTFQTTVVDGRPYAEMAD
jgi:hypothetical protein